MNIATEARKILEDCLYKTDELINGEWPKDAIMSKGTTTKIGLHPQRIKNNSDKIRELLNELPDEFKETGGGGMSFLRACMDRNGKQWGEHRDIEVLLCLGLAAGMIKYCYPREMWNILPGSMPFFTILKETPKC